MVPSKLPPRRIVHTQPGPSTAGGVGDILTDDRGCRWIVVSENDSGGTATPNTRRVENGWLR